MMLIFHKTNLYKVNDFIEYINKLDKLTGIMLDIIMTKDKKILVFSKNVTNETMINRFQNSNFDELIDDIITLEKMLFMLKKFKGKIIINFIPLNEALLIEDYKTVILNNFNYVKAVKEITDKFPLLNIYLCSSNYNLMYQIIRVFTINKKGVILNKDSSSYIDVDFYIFPPNMLNEKIMAEQLSFNKEVMIIIEDLEGFVMVINFLDENVANKDNYQYIINSPRFFYNNVYNI